MRCCVVADQSARSRPRHRGAGSDCPAGWPAPTCISTLLRAAAERMASCSGSFVARGGDAGPTWRRHVVLKPSSRRSPATPGPRFVAAPPPASRNAAVTSAEPRRRHTAPGRHRQVELEVAIFRISNMPARSVSFSRGGAGAVHLLRCTASAVGCGSGNGAAPSRCGCRGSYPGAEQVGLAGLYRHVLAPAGPGRLGVVRDGEVGSLLAEAAGRVKTQGGAGRRLALRGAGPIGRLVRAPLEAGVAHPVVRAGEEAGIPQAAPRLHPAVGGKVEVVGARARRCAPARTPSPNW